MSYVRARWIAWQTALGMVCLMAMARAEISCPADYKGQVFDRADVTDGPPGEIAFLVPQTGGWRLGYTPTSPMGFYLACTYRGTAERWTTRLPATTMACLFQKGWNVACQ